MNLFFNAFAQQLVATSCHACNQLHFQLCLQFSFCNAGWSLAARASHALGGMSGYKDICKRARPPDPAAPAPIDSQHVSSPTPVPASPISYGRSSHSSSTSGVRVPGIDKAHGSGPLCGLAWCACPAALPKAQGRAWSLVVQLLSILCPQRPVHASLGRPKWAQITSASGLVPKPAGRGWRSGRRSSATGVTANQDVIFTGSISGRNHHRRHRTSRSSRSGDSL